MASVNPPLAPPTDADAAIVARALKLNGFFPEFSGELCAKVFPRSGVAMYMPDERVIEQDEDGRDLFILLEGAVVSVTRGKDALAVLGTEALLGEVALLRDGRRTATVTASEPTRAFRLLFADLGYVLGHNPELAEHLRGLARQRAS